MRTQKKDKTMLTLILDDRSHRQIGYIKNGNYITQRDKDRHLFNKNNSYAFNYDTIIALAADWRVVVKEKQMPKNLVWTVSVKDLLEHNEYKHFKGQGYELQLFYPRDKLKIDFAKKFI